MTQLIPPGPEELARLAAVLRGPEHRTGIDERAWRIDRLEPVAAALVRVTGTLDGDDALDEWSGPNVALRIALPEAPAELAGLAGRPGAPTTTSRVYTVADVEPAARCIAVDVVRHEAASPMMRWLEAVRPGDAVVVTGPRPHRVPGAGSPRILVADSSALPAARSIIERSAPVPETILIAAAADDELEWTAAVAGLELRRADLASPTALADAFAALDVPASASVWAGGERDDVRAVRSRCREELGLPRERVQVFGYWKRGASGTLLDLARLRAAAERMGRGGGLDPEDGEDEA